MDKATVAVIVSAISAGIAMLSLGWNIFRDMILKPRLKVEFGVMHAFSPYSNETVDFISVSGTNFGPGSTIVQKIFIKKTSFWRKLLKKQLYLLCYYLIINYQKLWRKVKKLICVFHTMQTVFSR